MVRNCNKLINKVIILIKQLIYGYIISQSFLKLIYAFELKRRKVVTEAVVLRQSCTDQVHTVILKYFNIKE